MFEKLKFIKRILFNNNSSYYIYPCKDILYSALGCLKDGNIHEAYNEIVFVIQRAGDEITEEDQETFQKIKDMRKEYYDSGFQQAINYILDYAKYCNRYGYDGNKLVKLDKENSDENIGYINISDILKYGEMLKENNKKGSWWMTK